MCQPPCMIKIRVTDDDQIGLPAGCLDHWQKGSGNHIQSGLTIKTIAGTGVVDQQVVRRCEQGRKPLPYIQEIDLSLCFIYGVAGWYH